MTARIPPHLAALVGVATLIVWAIFFGYGFGSGSLVVAPPPSGFQYTGGSFEIGNSMLWTTNITSWTTADQVPTTAILASGESTAITVVVHVENPSGDDCSNDGQPVWAPGVGSNWGGLLISFGGQAFTITGIAGPVSSYIYTLNGTSEPVYYCLNGGVTGDHTSANLLNGGTIVMSETFTLEGPYSPGMLSASFIGTGTYCSGSGSTAACDAAGTIVGVGSRAGTGTFAIASTATISTYSGVSSIEVTNPGQLTYNGESLDVSASTGYDPSATGGTGTYSLNVYYPSARGGGIDSAFATKTVPSLDPDYATSWTVPAGTSQNSSTPGWNNFLVALTANYYFQGQATAGIDISPLYSPTTPIISADSDGHFVQPEVGDTETITVTSSAAGDSGAPTQIILWVFYAQAGEGASNLPACGSAWVTTGCTSGQTLSVSVSGSTGTATYSFDVDPPAGYTEIGVQAQSANSNTQQVSQISSFLINIVPSGTTCGESGAPICNTANLWSTIGPVLLSVGIVLLAAFVALLVTVPTWQRVVIIVLPVGIVVVLYIIGFGGVFDVGGALNGGGVG